MSDNKKLRVFIRVFGIIVVLILSACARYEWTQISSNGQSFEEAETQCRAKARKLLKYNTPIGQTYRGGAADSVTDSLVAQEKYEAERCLNAQGFKKTKVN